MNIEAIRKNPQATYLIGAALGLVCGYAIASAMNAKKPAGYSLPAASGVVPCGPCQQRDRIREFEARMSAANIRQSVLRAAAEKSDGEQKFQFADPTSDARVRLANDEELAGGE